MNAHPTFEKAEAYLNIQLTHSGPLGTPPATGAFVTLSREAGTAGTAFADLLARALNAAGSERHWQVYSGNLIEEMLHTNHLPTRLARFLPEDRTSEINASIGEIVGLHPNLWTLVHKANELMRQLAHGGHAILLGRGANFVTSGIGQGVHVRLVAPRDYRAAVTAQRRGLPHDQARAENERRDAARARYVRSTFGGEVGDATAYDVVINVAQVPVDVAIRTIVALVHGREHATLPAEPRPAA